MKKIYLLSLLCCLQVAAFAQITTTLWASGATGTYKTGNCSATGTRTDNAIVATGAAPVRRGYAVFDLSSIPAGSMINSVTCGYYVGSTSGTVITASNSFGFAGDLSLVTVPATLYADMVAGTSLTTTPYTTGTGNHTDVSTPAAVAFIQANIGSKISYCWTHTGNYVFNISGETGSTATTTTAGHAPYLIIDYCPPPVSVSASALPNPLCVGNDLSLAGTAAGSGTLSWSWNGPGGFTSALQNPTLTTDPTSAGVYTLTVTNNCAVGGGTATAVTPVVTLNPLPAPIGGGTDICFGASTTMTNTSGGGTWTSNDPAIASIVSGTGALTGVALGTTTLTYTLTTTGCYITSPMTVNQAPDPIAGPTQVCVGDAITLTDGVTGGVWTSSLPGIASVGSSSGIVTGIAPGVVTISYNTGGCPPATYLVTVNAIPSAISGPTQVCVGSIITLSDPDPTGVWGSSNITLATVGLTGDVSGVAPGLLNITFTNPVTTCQAVFPILVNDLPAAIGGVTNVCVGGTVTLTETTPGGTWSGGFPSSNIGAGSGIVTGLAAGVDEVTYTVATTNCSVTTPVTVNPLPANINTGTGVVCQGATIVYSDADAGGTWSSINVAIASVGVASGIITGGSTAGVTTIVYTLPTGCTASALVTVNPSPASLITPTGPTTFCTGGSVVLNGTTGAGFTYQWNKDGAALPGATNISFTAAATGAYVLTITNGLSCSDNSPVLNVVAGITGTITHTTPLEFCVGDVVVLGVNTGSAVGTIAYQWKKDGAAISFATNSTYVANASGDYSVAINISGGSGTCAVISDTDVVLVNPLPVPVINFTGTFLTTAAGYGSYQWFLNTVSIPGANSNVLLPTANGQYKVKVVNGNNCAGFSETFLITSVGVNELSLNTGISISPNPATTFLHIDAPFKVRAIVTGIEGKVLADQDNSTDINIAHFPAGMYLISLYNTNGTRVAVDKFIKE